MKFSLSKTTVIWWLPSTIGFALSIVLFIFKQQIWIFIAGTSSIIAFILYVKTLRANKAEPRTNDNGEPIVVQLNSSEDDDLAGISRNDSNVKDEKPLVHDSNVLITMKKIALDESIGIVRKESLLKDFIGTAVETKVRIFSIRKEENSFKLLGDSKEEVSFSFQIPLVGNENFIDFPENTNMAIQATIGGIIKSHSRLIISLKDTKVTGIFT